MTTETISWKGKHVFRIAGSRYHEDTLRIDSVRAKGEELLRLVLPTLCLTYADMAFANAIGGEQAVMCLTPATFAVVTVMMADAMCVYRPPGT